MIKDEKLDFWIRHHLNVLFKGKHGVGKTAMVVGAFDRANLRWRYFSAATMDPWVDFIGVPKAVPDGNGKDVLELVRPKDFADDAVEAIFFDEFNRSHKKIRNAVMELIQFKSINGRKFENLKIIWAAINPDDEDRYDVEKMDDAQIDRFHVHVTVPYKCSSEYFVKKFGSSQGKAAIQWWNGLPADQKELVSPRRLDYALEIGKVKGDLRDVLPRSSNISKLITSLQLGPIDQIIKEIMGKSDTAEAKRFLSVENNWSAAIQYILKNADRMRFFLPWAPPEKLAALLIDEKKVLNFILENAAQHDTFARVIKDVYQGTKNSGLKKTIENLCEAIPTDQLPEALKHLSTATTGVSKAKHGSRWKRNKTPWLEQLNVLRSRKTNNTHERRSVLSDVEKFLPPVLPKHEAVGTLRLLNDIAHHSYPTTLKRMRDFVPLANHCCAEITRNSPGDSQQELARQYKSMTEFIRRKLNLTGKSGQFAFQI